MELEIKAKVDDLNPVIKKLAEINAKLTKTSSQKDVYFSPPGKDFAGTKKYYLRIRFGAEASLDYHIVHSYIETEEHEVKIQNPEKMKEILVDLGFRIDCTVEKERSVYETEQFFIMVDKVNSLGNFVEIEAKTDKVFINDIFKMMETLNLRREELVKGMGYTDMIMEKNKTRYF
jgi:adenylate cyclase class 2